MHTGLAVTAASLVGVAQVAARVAEAGWLTRLHPLVTARLGTALHPLGRRCSSYQAAPAAFVFSALHGAGMGLMTIVRGTLPLALLGTAGSGRRTGLLEAPSRIVQALTPMLFGVWLDRWGAAALRICAGISALGRVGAMRLRRQ